MEQQPGPEKLAILAQTAAWAAVAKPEGLAAIPERAADDDCVQTRLQQQLGMRVYVVHRLDKDVSGVLLFALTAAAHRSLNLAFEQRLVKKKYLALAWGAVTPGAGEIAAPLREFGSGRMGVAAAGGKPSLTRYRRLAGNADYSLLEVAPETGRRHQIRVHLYHLGHPLAGDRRYGERARQAGWVRLMLHAWELTLPPAAGGPATIVAPPGASFGQGLAAAGLAAEGLVPPGLVTPTAG